MSTIGNGTKTKRYSTNDLAVEEAISCGISENIAKTLIPKRKTKDKISKTRDVSKFGSKKPKWKDYRKNAAKLTAHLFEPNLEYLEYDMVSDFDDVEDNVSQVLENTNKKITLEELKNLRI